MNNKAILLSISIIVLVLSILWWYEIVNEPIVGIGTAILTVVGYLFLNVSKEKAHEGGKLKKSNRYITQNHKGKGDNIAGDKIIR